MITPAGSFGMFAVVGALTWLFAYVQLPELSGVSLNDVDSAIHGSSQTNNNAGYTGVRGDDEDEQESAFRDASRAEDGETSTFVIE